MTSQPLDFPSGSAGKEPACNAGDLGAIPGLGQSPGVRERLPTSVFWSGELCELYSPWDHKESDAAEQLSLTMTVIYYFSRFCGLAEWVLGWFHQVLRRLHLAGGSTGLGASKAMSPLLKDGTGYGSSVFLWAFLVAQVVKSLPATQETQV